MSARVPEVIRGLADRVGRNLECFLAIVLSKRQNDSYLLQVVSLLVEIIVCSFDRLLCEVVEFEGETDDAVLLDSSGGSESLFVVGLFHFLLGHRFF